MGTPAPTVPHPFRIRKGSSFPALKPTYDNEPSNILVTKAGRVVLLDFGIVADLLPSAPRQRARGVMGTVPYLAPEQAQAGAPIGAAADFYAVGVLLYLALTGQHPYRGSTAEVLAAKASAPPPPPHALCPGVPFDLDTLCMELLSIDPAQRPGAAELLRRLRVGRTVEERSRAALPIVFIGRQAELQAMEEALATTQRGVGTTLLLYGESGIGKSFLVRSFTARVLEKDPSSLVLAGRCYERESVPFKALDTVIDQLAEYLLSLPAPQALPLLPEGMSALAQVFPVLSPLVPAGAVTHPADAFEQRRVAFLTLRSLLQRLAALRPLVLVIDDLQWADVDSLALLGELLRPPAPPPMLLIGTVRTTATTPDVLKEGAQLDGLPGGVRRISISKLPAADAEELVWQLLAAVSSDPKRSEAAAIARETAGHPLFIDELIRQRLIDSSVPAPRLDDALWARVQRLPVSGQRLLELCAVAGVPVSRRLAGQAAVLSGEELDSLVAQLRAAHLLRAGAHVKDAIEPYHDRVRESVLAHLTDEARAQWHGRLAVALEQDGAAPPEALLRHWLESGNRERAADYALRAAQHAESALAFEQAASCYRQALALREVSGNERVTLNTKLGEALANASRGAESAEAFLTAMQAARGATAQRLKQRASEQLLRSGHIDRGVRLLREILSSLGLKYAETPRQALLQILWYRARLRLRGLHFTPRSEEQIPEEELLRLDACRSAAESLSLIDVTRGSVFRSQFMLLALQSGERERIVLGSLLEASILTSAGGEGEAAALPVLAMSRRLAAESGTAKAAAMVTFSEASIEHNLGRWRRARELFDDAESAFRARCTGVAWEVSTARFFSIRCSLYLGEFVRITNRLEADLEEAAQRGDLYMEICLRTTPVPRLLLVHDQPQAARQALFASAQLMGDREYPLQRYYQAVSLIDLDLYEGRAADACRGIDAENERLRQLYLLRVQVVRIMAAEQRARCLLRLAAGCEGRERKGWLEQAATEAATIRREAAPWSMPLAMRHEAAILALRGDVEPAKAKLSAAISALAAVHMNMYAAALRLVSGQLIGGTEGEGLIQKGTTELLAEGVVAPARWAAFLHPGIAESKRK